jgi:hypothetical protein
MLYTNGMWTELLLTADGVRNRGYIYVTLVPPLISSSCLNPVETAAKHPQKSHLTMNFILTLIFSIAMPALATQMD